MRRFLAWVGLNLARFVCVWLVCGTVGFFIVSFGGRIKAPHSALQALSAPLAVVVVVFLGLFTAAILLVFASFAVATWLLVYLPPLWWLDKLFRGNVRRIAAVALSPLPFAFIRLDDRHATFVALGVAALCGCAVSLPARDGRHTSFRDADGDGIEPTPHDR